MDNTATAPARPYQKRVVREGEQGLIATHEQVVAAGQYGMHEHGARLLARQSDRAGIRTGFGRHIARPCRQVAGHAMQRRIGQQQHALCGDLQSQARVDECGQARGAIASKDIREPLRVDAQDLGTTVLDGHLPCVPQWRGEQYQCRDAESDVTERQREGG